MSPTRRSPPATGSHEQYRALRAAAAALTRRRLPAWQRPALPPPDRRGRAGLSRAERNRGEQDRTGLKPGQAEPSRAEQRAADERRGRR